MVPVKHWEGDELVNEYVDVLRGEDLQETVREAARHDDVWVERHFIEPRHDEALLDGWRRFSHEVMYRTRHVFWLAPSHPDEAHLGGGEIRPQRSSMPLVASFPKQASSMRFPPGTACGAPGPMTPSSPGPHVSWEPRRPLRPATPTG
ncbi:HEPN-associated N-terminal domain-containing protein [Streptomyces sp. HF10]|uniref:HEPN-associated N-terminal domain-containing protein n=1 Tax=Streptomyces sp. HF10 TaxID=2692233 RepID=UPI001318014C|nr:hypothetical protein GR129_18560 [Streptomyces sp. HF10]